MANLVPAENVLFEERGPAHCVVQSNVSNTPPSLLSLEKQRGAGLDVSWFRPVRGCVALEARIYVIRGMTREKGKTALRTEGLPYKETCLFTLSHLRW